MKVLLMGMIILYSPLLMGQSLAQWTFENITSAVPSIPISASSHSSKISRATATVQGGNNNGSPDICSGAETWSTNFWPTSTSKNNGEYLEFKATAKNGYKLNVSGFFFRSNISSLSAARRFEVYYSTDGFSRHSHFLGSATNSTYSICNTFSYTFFQEVPDGGTITFRIYPYQQDVAAQAATLRIDNVTILGTSLLPVQLVVWNARKLSDGIELFWSTSSEINNDFFQLERKSIKGSFEILTQMEGKGRSSSGAEYTFIDDHPILGENIYRLKQVDVDGAFSYSRLLILNFGDEEELQIYPTLVKNELHIKQSNSSKELVQIFDINGNLKLSKFINNEKNFTLNLSKLPNGFYLIVLKSKQLTHSSFFTKL